MSSIIDRFQGDAGRSHLIDALVQQKIVNGNRALAEEIADCADLVEVEESQAIITQGENDNDLFLILAGAFKIVVNGRDVASRGRGDHVGEMVVIEPTQTRSASVIAIEPALVAKLSCSDASEIASKHPEIYRIIASTLARRLLERNKLVEQHRDKIRVFVISSAEGVDVARKIQGSLEYDNDIDVSVWTDGVFRAGRYLIEALEGELDDCDFAIAVAHSDDKTLFRGESWPTPRDNVVFELGLFMGRLGRYRAILMEPREDKVKLPSDLNGVTTITYKYEPGAKAVSRLAPACDRLRDHIKELGPFNG